MKCRDILDWLPILISFVALAFSMMQFICERKRNRREATIHAFDALEGNTCIQYLFLLSARQINDLVQSKEECDVRIHNEWNELSKALALIEHFAVGINSSVYDLKILNSMAGNKMISVFDNCKRLLEFKRSGINNEHNYSEFEEMIERIKGLRTKH